VAGFVGALFEWIDLDLLIATANVAPDILFVFVGPTRRGVSIDRLRTLPNVRCFGAQSFEVVSRWIQAFDVCMIPFRQDPVSDCADPIKLYEYLALGKPVVGTSQFGPRSDPAPMCVVSDALGFARSIRQAIHGSPDQRASRIAYALRHTWTHRAQAFAELPRELLQ
jgi:glycosyltransferase involved in cell wall biosynthesis